MNAYRPLIIIFVIWCIITSLVCLAHSGTLEEDLLQYKPDYASGPFGIMLANMALESDLTARELADPSFALLMVRRPKMSLNLPYYWPFIEYCNSMGWTLTEDVEAAAIGLDPDLATKLLTFFKPSVSLPTDLDELTSTDVLNLSTSAFPDLVLFHITDSLYIVPTMEALELIDQKIDVSTFKYIKEQRDCDDFVRMWRGYLSQVGYGNLMAGYCEISFKKLDGSTYYHAVVMLAIDNGFEYNWAIYDPQLQPGTLTWLDGQTKYNELKIRKLIW